MTPQQFIAKWQRVNLSERSACQQHFLDLCELLDQPKPAEADPDGQFYTFEKGVKKIEGGDGWADVWMRGHFGWEYKRKHKDLKAAYAQLLLYREDLENPPLLVVCDMDRFQVHTNFTATAKREYEFDLAGLAEPANLDVLRKLFTEPEALRPGITSESLTVEAARRFGELADAMRQKGIEPLHAAHFLMKLMFCMFGEDIGLLPAKQFSRLLDDGKANPASLNRRLQNLFAAMEKGGDFGPVEIPRFNGGLFADSKVIPLTGKEIKTLVNVNTYDWASVEPSIFGTLFQRTLDPSQRAQIGAQFTGRDDIETLLRPVLLAPLRHEWEEVKRKCEEKLWPAVGKEIEVQGSHAKSAIVKASRQRKAFDRAILNFAERLHHATVLDPACGSGNFLYVAIHMLLDLEKEVLTYAADRGLSLVPHVSPAQLHGLEINPYAQQLAQVVIWIGYLQWMHYNGFPEPRDPVLQPIESIRCQDAIIDLSDPEHPKEPEWPEAEFIVGNPPFLGSRLLRRNLGDEYVERLFRLYQGRLKKSADLCCYWLEKARAQIETGQTKRVGLLGTQSVRGGASRLVLDRIKDSGDIFFGVSDRNWTLEGAMVHVSMVGFDDGSDTEHVLDGARVSEINSDLTSGPDTTEALRLATNVGVAFQGVTPMGPFDISGDVARRMLAEPLNPGGRPNSDVIRRWANGEDFIKGRFDEWIIDMSDLAEEELAAAYEAPFEHVKTHVLAARMRGETQEAIQQFWRHWRPRPAMRRAIASLGSDRYLVTPRVGKHRVFIWVGLDWLPSDATVAFATADDYSLGVLHARTHETWARRTGTQLREAESGFRYTHQTCFETFPLPEATDSQRKAIASAARKLDRLRHNWLNPPEWTREEVMEFRGSADGPWARYVHAPDDQGIGTVRWPRTVPKDPSCAESLEMRTLTNLYNERPTWLAQAHQKLDEAVFAAYGWNPAMSDEELLERLLKLNLEQSTI